MRFDGHLKEDKLLPESGCVTGEPSWIKSGGELRQERESCKRRRRGVAEQAEGNPPL